MRLVVHTLRLVVLVPFVLGVAAADTTATQESGRVLEVRPGDDGLSGATIVPFVANYQVWDETDDGERELAQTWTRSVMLVRVAEDTTAIDETWYLHFAALTVYDQNIYLRDSFRPLMKRVLSWRGNDIVQFTDDALHYTFAPRVGFNDEPASSTEITRDDPEPRFGAGGNFALATMQLQVGDRISLPSIGADPGVVGELVDATVEVVARERVDAAGRTFETMRVRSTDSDSEFWLAHEAPYVIQRRFGKRVWELSAYSTLPAPW